MVHYDLICSCGFSKFTPSYENSRAFISAHFALGHRVRVRDGAGYPVVRRFVIRRHDVAALARNPWVLRDRSRPAYLGHFATLELAIAAVYRKVAQEYNLPTKREIEAAMTPRETLPEAVTRARAFNNPGVHNHVWGETPTEECPVCSTFGVIA